MSGAADGERWDVAIDIGGTFTDVVAIGTGRGRRAAKVLSNPDDPLAGVRDALAQVAIDAGDVDVLVHATTLAANTVVQRRGAQVGLVTTAGFRDVIETGREDRFHLYDLAIERPAPLVARERRLGVRERIGADGAVIAALDREALRAAAERLRDVDAVAVCFLNAYKNRAHEQEAASLLREWLPSAFVTASSEVAPIIREYERFSATIINAYLAGTLSSYLAGLQQLVNGEVAIMRSDGGLCSCAEAEHVPAHVLESGPAAGAIAAARTASACGETLAIAFDMGGTTSKGCVIVDGDPAATDELEIARSRTGVRGSGLPLRLPSVDLVEIGVGGGSIARIDALGLLSVGPQSAGAEPGPACFGRGGTDPTLTDANLVLGLLTPGSFAVDGHALDAGAAAAAIERGLLVAQPGVDVADAAWGIHELANSIVADAIRFHCLEAGVDPRRCALIASGGGGPLHAAGVLAKLGARRAIVSPGAAVASAQGLLLAPRVRERSHTDIVALDELDAGTVAARLERLEAELRRGAADGFEARWYLHMRLRSQWYDLRVPVATPVSPEAIADAFAAAYGQRFGRAPADAPLEIVTWTVRLVADRDRDGHGSEPREPGDERPRDVYLGPAFGRAAVDVVEGASFAPGEDRAGPLLVGSAGAATLVGADQRACVDEHGNVHITPAGKSAA